MPLATTAAPARKRMLPEGERVDVAALVASPAGVGESAPVDVDESAPVLLSADGSVSLHASVLHACEDAPLQSAPLFVGAGFVQVRFWIPPPHVAEHAPKGDQPPSARGT